MPYSTRESETSDVNRGNRDQSTLFRIAVAVQKSSSEIVPCVICAFNMTRRSWHVLFTVAFLLLATESLSYKCKKTLNYNGLNVFAMKVKTNLFLDEVKPHKPVWKSCALYDLQKAVTLDYLPKSEEYVAHFTCPNPDNKFCDETSTECLESECDVTINDKNFCLSVGLNTAKDNMAAHFYEGTCGPEFKPLEKVDVEAGLKASQPDPDSLMSLAVARMSSLYHASKDCVDNERRSHVGMTLEKANELCRAQVTSISKDAHSSILEVLKSLTSEDPSKQTGIVSRIDAEQAEVEKLKAMRDRMQKKQEEIAKGNRKNERVKEENEKEEERKKIESDQKAKAKLEKKDIILKETASSTVLKQKKLQVKKDQMEKAKHFYVTKAMADQLKMQELEALGRNADAKAVRDQLKMMMDKKLAIDKAEAQHEAEAKALSLRQTAIEMERRKVAAQEEETVKHLQREKIEFEKASRLRDEQTNKMEATKINMGKDLRQLKEDTRKIEERMLKHGMKWDGQKPYDATDINEKAQEEARKQMEAMVQGYAGTLQAHYGLRNAPVSQPGPAKQTTQAINIVIGCGGEKCKRGRKIKKAPGDSKKVEPEKDTVVKEAVEKQLRAIKEDKEVEDGDRLERRRLELEHDQRVQETAANDVKKALEEKKKSEEKADFLSAQLNGQRKDTMDAKSDLAREKSIAAELSKKTEERKEQLQEVAASARR